MQKFQSRKKTRQTVLKFSRSFIQSFINGTIFALQNLEIVGQILQTLQLFPEKRNLRVSAKLLLNSLSSKKIQFQQLINAAVGQLELSNNFTQSEN